MSANPANRLRLLVALLLTGAALFVGCDVTIVDQQSDRFACEDDDDCLDGFVCAQRSGVNICVSEAQVDQDVSGGDTADTSTPDDTNIGVDIPDDLPIDFELDIPFDTNDPDGEDTTDTRISDSDDTTDSVDTTVDMTDTTDAVDTTDTVVASCPDNCPDTATVQLFYEGDGLNKLGAGNNVWTLEGSQGGEIRANESVEPGPQLTGEMEVGFDASVNDQITFTLTLESNQLATADVSVGDGDRVLVLAVEDAIGQLVLTGVNVSSSFSQAPVEVAALHGMLAPPNLIVEARELAELAAEMLEASSGVGPKELSQTLAGLQTPLDIYPGNERRRLATFNIPWPEFDNVMVGVQTEINGTPGQTSLAIINVDRQPMTMQVYETTIAPECAFGQGTSNCPQGDKCLPQRRDELRDGALFGKCVRAGAARPGSTCSDTTPCEVGAVCDEGICRGLCDPTLNPNACPAGGPCLVTQPGAVWGVCGLPEACPDSGLTCTTVTGADGRCDLTPFTFQDVGICDEEGVGGGFGDTCNVDDDCAPLGACFGGTCDGLVCSTRGVNGSCRFFNNGNSGCAPVFRTYGPRTYSLAFGLCTEGCDYRQPTAGQCPSSKSCFPAPLFEIYRDICIDNPPKLTLGANCAQNSLANGALCGVIARCVSRRPNAPSLCRELCLTDQSNGEFGPNNPDCSQTGALCLNVFDDPDVGACVVP